MTGYLANKGPGDVAGRKKRQAQMLDLLAAGCPVGDACRKTGIVYNTFHQWKQRYPDFRARVEIAKAKAKDPNNLADFQGRRGFAEFRKLFFGYDTYEHQVQIVDMLERIKPGEMGMVNVYPESGKTTTVGDWLCQTLGERPNERVTYLSESSGLCRKVIGRVKQRMTNHRDFGAYIEEYGPFYQEGQEKKGKPWAADYMTVHGAHHDEQDYSLEARAITSAAYGTRIDTLIIDDVISRRNVGQSETVEEHLRQTYFTRGRKMRTIIIGTLVERHDLYERFLDSGLVKEANYVQLPAQRADGTIVGPEMWVPNEYDLATLSGSDVQTIAQEQAEMMRKRVGERVWFASYQQQPSSNTLATFTDADIEKCKNSALTIHRPEAGSYVALSLDPSTTGGNAITACEYRTDETDGLRLRVLDQQIDYNLGRNEEIMSIIDSFATRYHPSILVVENNAFQKGFARDDRLEALGSRHGFRIEPHTTGRNKLDPIWGVRAMASSFMRGEIEIPDGDEFAKTRMEPFCKQLRNWRPDVPTRLLRQDAVMSFWFNWIHWQQFVEMSQSNVEAWRRPPLRWQPILLRSA